MSDMTDFPELKNHMEKANKLEKEFENLVMDQINSIDNIDDDDEEDD